MAFRKRLIIHDADEAIPEIKISALFLLNDPAITAASGGIDIHPLCGANTIMSIIKRALLLDAEDMSVVAHQFASAKIASCAPAVNSVSYERDYDQLDALHAAIFSKTGLSR